MTTKELFTQVFTKLGVDPKDPVAHQILATQKDTEVPQEFASKFEGNFLTEEAALQNPSIRKRIKAEALNGVDNRIKAIVEKHEMTDEDKEAIFAGDTTDNRVSNLVDKIASLQQEKIKTTGKDRDQLTQEIQKLNNQILSINNANAAKVQELESARKSDRMGWELDGIYKSFEYAIPGASKEVSAIAAKAIMAEYMQKNGAKFELGDQGLSIMTEAGTPMYVNNQPVSSASDYVKKALLESKILKATETAPQRGQQPVRTQTAKAPAPEMNGRAEFERVLDNISDMNSSATAYRG